MTCVPKMNKITLYLKDDYDVDVLYNKDFHDDNGGWESKSVSLSRGYGKTLWNGHKFTLTVAKEIKKVSNIDIYHKSPDKLYNYHVLKSAIQKAVRRCKVKEAILLSLQTICQNCNAFIRRISIIMIEDSIIHKGLPFIIWTMIAMTKGYKLTIDDVYQLLLIVSDIASVKYRDQFKSGYDYVYVNPLLDKDGNLVNKNKYLLALILRGNYGGMKNDISMIEKFILQWDHRFKDCTHKDIFRHYKDVHNNNKFIRELIVNKPYLTKSCLLRDAKDFHCYPSMLTDVVEKYPKYGTFDIKKTIWYFRSGLYTKVYINTKYNPSIIINNKKKNKDKYINSPSAKRGKLRNINTWIEIKKYWDELVDSYSF